MFTKDITTGYNQTINWRVVNSVVDEAEPKYRAMLILSASLALDSLSFTEALTIIKSNYLGNDILCLKGAQWIVANYDSTIHKRPVFTAINVGKTKLQKTVLSFLNAYFSDKKEFSAFVKYTNAMRCEIEWTALTGLGIKYVSKDLFATQEEKQKYFNPVKSITLSGIVDNIKNRYTLILSDKIMSK